MAIVAAPVAGIALRFNRALSAGIKRQWLDAADGAIQKNRPTSSTAAVSIGPAVGTLCPTTKIQWWLG
jgi:hypothetical protein